jgi:hypothetical protein
MFDEIIPASSAAIPVPLPSPRVEINIRPGVMSDVPFLDSLQKLHTKQVGWMPTAQFEGKIRLGHVLVAEEGSGVRVRGSGNAETESDPARASLNPEPRTLNPVGYCIGNDQYFKRDDVGIIYQLNVAPGKQRGYIGAVLLKAMFERAAYGCKLFCCWCAQDIEANYFWQAMGFVPLAFRTGSRTKGKGAGARKTGPRVHIFWQKRIRANDETTPWWFPSKTAGGSIREDRLVLPIPPGVRWSDEMPMILPSEARDEGENPNDETGNPNQIRMTKSEKRKASKAKIVETRSPVRRNGLRFEIPKQGAALPPFDKAQGRKAKPKAPRVKAKNDPRLIAAARELRDRWLEEVNAGRYLPQASGKYEVCRQIDMRAREPGVPYESPALPMPLAA